MLRAFLAYGILWWRAAAFSLPALLPACSRGNPDRALIKSTFDFGALKGFCILVSWL
jgi:hypothetical protein